MKPGLLLRVVYVRCYIVIYTAVLTVVVRFRHCFPMRAVLTRRKTRKTKQKKRNKRTDYRFFLKKTRCEF